MPKGVTVQIRPTAPTFVSPSQSLTHLIQPGGFGISSQPLVFASFPPQSMPTDRAHAFMKLESPSSHLAHLA